MNDRQAVRVFWTIGKRKKKILYHNVFNLEIALREQGQLDAIRRNLRSR